MYTYRCVKNIYSCNKRVCCSGFFVIALVAVPVSSVRYTQCVSILAHNALSRARWNNDTIRSPIAVRQPMICSTVLSPFFPSPFRRPTRLVNVPPFSHLFFDTTIGENDFSSCLSDTLACTPLSTVSYIRNVKNAKIGQLGSHFFSLEAIMRGC